MLRYGDMTDAQRATLKAHRWGSWGADTRRWAFFNIGAFMCPMDTGRVHGPGTDEATLEWRYGMRPGGAFTSEPATGFPWRRTTDYQPHEPAAERFGA